MADYRVSVGVFVEDESLENLKTQIRDLKTEKIKVSADTDGVKRELGSVNKLLNQFKTPVRVKLHVDDNGVFKKIASIKKELAKLGNTKTNLNINAAGGKAASTPRYNTAGTEKDLKRIKKAYQEIANLTSKKIKLDGVVNAGEIAEMEAQLDRARTKVVSLRSSLETRMGSANFAKAMGDDFEKAINKIALAEAKVDDVKQKLYSKVKSDYSGSANLSKMFDVDNKIESLGTVNQTTTASVEKLRAAYANLGNALNSGDVDQAIKAQKRFEDALEETNYAIKKNQALNRNMASAQSLDLGRQRLGNDIEMWSRTNTIAAREFENELDVMKAKLKTCDSIELGNLRSEFNKLKTDAQLAGKTGMSFGDNIKDKFSRLGGYMAASMGVMEAVMLMRSMFDAVLKVDTAMTELYRVTDLTSSGYEQLYSSMTSSAKEYGVVLSNLISSTAAWARLGFDANTANSMAEISAMYQHIADVDYDTAVENLVTGFKGFETQLGQMFGDDHAASMEYIADIYNELGNNFAIGSDQVGDSLTRAASALSIAGNSIEQSAGMVTAVTEVTQDPEKAGTAMKILSLRLRGMKGELQDLGEPIDENVEDISKMQQQIYTMTGEKVNIFDDMGNFKSTYEIMQGISEVWDDLSSVQQADLLETIAGKHRANEVAALINNWEQAEAAAETAENASGSASQEHAKYMDSLAGRINTFQATWQVLSNTLVDSDFLKGAVSGATAFLSVLDEVINALGVLPTLMGAAAGGFAMFKTFQRSKNGQMGMGFNVKKDQFGNAAGMQWGKGGAKQFMQNNALSKSYNAGYSQGFKFDPAFQKQVDTDRAALARLDAALKKTKSGVMSFKEVEKHMAGASKEAVNYAKYNQQNLLDSANQEKLNTEQKKSAVAFAAQDKSLKNVGRLMKEYNTQCKTVGMSQAAFAQSCGQGNAVLGKYMASLNGAKGSMGGYIASLVSTKAASVALQGATMALNGALSMGAGILATLVMSAAINGIMKLVNAEQELSDKVADATAKYEEQKSALGDTGTFNDLASRYKELSAGVTGNGMNMSLTTAEYEEYKQVVAELAELMPELVNGYNAEGVAILSCAGSYEQLQKAREDAIVANSRELKETDDDIFRDFHNAERDAESTGFWGDQFNLSSAKELNKYFDGEYKSLEEALGSWNTETQSLMRNAFEDAGIEMDEELSTSEQLKQALQGEPERCKQVATDFMADIEEELSSVKSLADAHIAEMFASSDSGYEFSEEMQSTINNVLGSLDYNFYNQFNSADELYAGLNDMLTKFSELDQELLPESLDMLADFNAEDISLGDYYKQIGQVTDATKNWDEATKQAVNDMLNIDSVTQTYENLTRDIESLGDIDLSGFSSIEEYINQLTASEASSIIQIIPEFQGDSLADLDAAIREHVLLTPIDLDISVESEGIQKVNDALAQSASATGLTSDSIAALETRYSSLAAKGYDVSEMFENTANGVHINAQAYQELEDAYNLENMSEMEQKLTDLADRHANLTQEIAKAKQAGEDTSAMELELSQVDQLINDTERLKSQYQGLTSAYASWQAAAEGGQERDMYTSVGEGLQGMKETLEDGWLDAADKQLLELVTGQELLTATTGECLEAYKGLDKAINSAGYSVNDFFTYDEDGNATATGIKQFWETVDAAEKEIGKNVVKKNKDGHIIAMDVEVDDKKAIADALGISEELVDIFIRASADAGFTVDMDGNMTALSEMKKSAEEAYASLKKMDGNIFKFDFNATSGEELTKNLNEAKALLKNEDFYVDGKFNMDAKGAKDAFEIASYFQSIEDKNTFSAYLSIDATAATEEMQEPLLQVQSFADLTMQKHQLELTGGDTTKINKQLDQVAQNLYKIENSEVKAQLGIDGMNQDEILSALESGEVKVPGTVDFEANMSSSMEKIADYISVLTGQMSQEQFNLKYPVQIETETKVDTEKVKEAEEEVKQKVQETEAELKELEGEPIDVDLNIEATAENIDTINKRIEDVKSAMQNMDKLDLTPEVKTAMLDDAKAKLEALIQKKQLASQPSFMNLDTSQVSASMQDALTKVQAYQTALNEVNRLSELKEAGIAIDDSEITAAQQKAEECLAAIEGLDGDVKVAIGLEENGDADSIMQSFANNSVKFELDAEAASAQVHDVKTAVDEIEDKEVSIKADVEGLEQVKELNTNIDLATSIEGSVANLSEFVKDAQALSKLDSNIVADVTANVSGNVLDTAEIKLNNLEVFAESAKGLKNVGSPISRVEANVEGNVIDTPEMFINNIKTFVDSAKGIHNIGSDTKAKITADAEGNVFTKMEFSINNLKTFIDSAKGIENIGSDVKANITANVNGNVFSSFEFTIDNLKKFIDSSKGIENINGDIQANITANANGNVFERMEFSINNLKTFIESAKGIEDLDGGVNATVVANASGTVFERMEFSINNLKTFIESAKGIQDLDGGVNATVVANANGNVFERMEFSIDNLKTFIESAKGIEALDGGVNATIVANANGTVFERMEFSINNLKTFIESAKGIKDLDGGVNATVVANANGNVFERMEFSIDNIKTFIESAKGVKDLDGGADVNIVANADGNVFERMEFSINNIKTFIESAKGVKDLDGGATVNIEANADGNVFERMEFSIDNIKKFIESAEGIEDLDGGATVNIVANADGNVFERMEFSIDNIKTFVDSADGIKDLQGNISSNITADVGGNVFSTFELTIDNLKEYINSAKGIRNFEGNISSSITADIDGNVFTTFEMSIDNLKEYINSAKGIKNIEGNIKSSITADIDGNVFSTMEMSIDNLKEYISSAKGIRKIEGNIESSITADVDGNVFTTLETTIDNLGKFISSAKGIRKIEGEIKSNITANLFGNIDKKDDAMSNMKTFANAAKTLQDVETKKVAITANIKGKLTDDKIEKLVRFKDAAKGLPKSTTVSVTVKADVDKLTSVRQSLQKLSDSGVMKNYSANVTVNVSGKDAIVTVKNAISKIVSKTVNVVASVSGTNLVNALKTAISKLKGKTVKVQQSGASGAKSKVDELKGSINALPKSKSVTITASTSGAQTISNLRNDWEAIKSKSVTLTVNKKGDGDAGGTAGATGSAFSRGNWGIDGSGIALGGELGQELVVRDGRFFTIGDKGAEFFRYKKNDIIFNAAQTESLFKYGGIKGANPRGKMLASGSAFAEGTHKSGKAFANTHIEGVSVLDYMSPSEAATPSVAYTTPKTTTPKTTPKDTPKETKKEFEEVFDWVERKIENLEKTLERLGNTADNVFKNWTVRNNALDKSITQLRSNIQTLRSAYQEYMSQANSITFSKWDKNKKKWVYSKEKTNYYRNLVQSGKLDISKITNENRAKKLKEYQEWWDKAQDVLEDIDNATAELAQKYVDKFDNIVTKYEGKLARFENGIAQLEERISQAEAQGHLVSTEYYTSMQAREENKQKQLQAEKTELLAQLEKAVRSGAVQIGSEQWQNMVDEIDSVSLAIMESETAVLEYEQTIREMEWESFDRLMDKIGRITEETEFLRTLLEDDKLFNEDTGELTDAGLATMGTHTADYNTHMEAAQRYRAEAAELNKVIAEDAAKGIINQEAIDRMNELADLEREEILAAQDSKKAIRDLVEEGINYELEALQERIDKTNEVLETQKDLYDYQKKVKEQTKEIADIEKQLAAYAGDDSEEAKQQIQKLKVSLEEAQAELEETEYDRYMSGQEELLDNLYEEYEELLNARLDNLDELVADVSEMVNAGADTISTAIETAAGKVGYDLSTVIKETWSGSGPATTTYSGGSSDSSSNASGAVGNVETQHNAEHAANEGTANTTTTTAADSPQATNAKQGDGKIQVNDLVTLKKSTNYYSTKSGTTGSGKKKKSSKKGTTKKENKLFVTYIDTKAAYPYRLSWRRDRSTGDLGWVKLRGNKDKKGNRRYNFTGYATGIEKVKRDETAWTQEQGREFIVRPSDGAILTPLKKGDSVLNAYATGNIWDMANDPAQFIKDNLNLEADANPVVQSACNTYTQNLDNVNFVFPDVKNYDEMLAMFKKDKNFERLLLAMTLDVVAGKSSLGKGKAIR